MSYQGNVQNRTACSACCIQEGLAEIVRSPPGDEGCLGDCQVEKMEEVFQAERTAGSKAQ